jgi:hypothetical protein
MGASSRLTSVALPARYRVGISLSTEKTDWLRILRPWLPSWYGRCVTKSRRQDRPQSRNTVQVPFRVPTELAEQLDAWVDEINARRAVLPVTRNGLLMSIVVWGVTHKPEWAGDDPPEPT